MLHDPSSTSGSGPTAVPPLIGAAGAGLRLRPYLRPSAADAVEGEDPFVFVADGPLPYRALLASGKVDGQLLLPFLTLLIQPNDYPGSRTGTPQPAATNQQVDRVWEEAFRSWKAARGEGLVDLELRLLSDPDTLPRHAPITYCSRVGEYFEPLCPACLGPLRVCRNEGTLRTAGLPSYAETLQRFLHCPACQAGSGAVPTFYTWTMRPIEGLAPGVRLRRRTELYRDLATRIRTGPKPEGRHHPCFDCDWQNECYPAGRSIEERVGAEELLIPLSYYDTAMIPLEARPFGFREAAALLGGAAPAEIGTPDGLPDPGDPLREATLAGLAAEREQFLFAGDPTGLLALEAFYLKMTALIGLVRGVRSLHAAAGRPHLALSPERIRGGLVAAEGAPLPARWRLILSLGDLLTTAPQESVERHRIGNEPVVRSIPFPLPEAFVPDALARVQSTTHFMRLTPRKIEFESRPEGKVARLRAELLADGYREADHGRNDLVRVVLAESGSDGARITLAGRKIETISGGFVFEGMSAPLPEAGVRAVEALRAASSVEVSLVASFGPPVDVASLGLLLLRLLLVNDEQDATAVDRNVVERLAAAVAAPDGRSTRTSAPGDQERHQRSRLAEILARESLRTGPEQVLYRGADRALAPPATPIGLWHETLLLGLRMASSIPGWSVRGRLDDFDPAAPSAAIDEVLEEMAMLAERARGALIGSGGRNGLIQQVCDDFLTDLQEALARDAEVAGGADRTVVVPARGGA